MALSPEQMNEARRLYRIMKQYEGIIRTSRNAEQLHRAKVDLKKVRDSLEAMFPSGIPANLDAPEGPAPVRSDSYPGVRMFPVTKASPNCEDDEVNTLATALRALEEHFFPSMTEKKIKLEYSKSVERDTLYPVLENAKRHLKILTDTIEDSAVAMRDDMKAQLQDLRRRYTRVFFTEGGTALRKTLDFWRKIKTEINDFSSPVRNPDDRIEFDRTIETPTMFDGRPVLSVIDTAINYLSDVIDFLRIPEIRS